MSSRVASATVTFPNIINREAAEQKLKSLTPGTQEHRQLQDVLVKAAGIVEVSLSQQTYKVNTRRHQCQLLGGFGASEHVAIGEEVKLKGLPDDTPLLIKGTCKVQFQDIIALAGDYYGIVGQPISFTLGDDAAKGDMAKTARFENAFNALAQGGNKEVREILLEIHDECSSVKRSGLPHHCYGSQMMAKNKVIKGIKDDIEELLKDNSDHFSHHATEAYRIGHQLAMRVAREAGIHQDVEGLKRAYALEAFADHFLTDLFSAGHIRNQRGELEEFLITKLEFPPGFSMNRGAKPLAAILTAAQHQKDGEEGLNVANKRGERWRAYGDGNFFSPGNKENKKKVVAATQASVDEVYNAYLHPEQVKDSRVSEIIPFVTDINPAPVYAINDGTLVLNSISDQIEIKTQKDYLTSGISQALRYLPESYISGFITPYFEMPPILDKVIIPQVERLTGVIWHMIGLSTYHQVKQVNRQLNEKIDEMADKLDATYKNTEEILTQMCDVKANLNQLLWSDVFQELRVAIATIKDVAHQHKNFKGNLTESQRHDAEMRIFNAFNTISRIFSTGNADGTKILGAYTKALEASGMMSLDEIKIAVTLWFREIVECQIQALCLYSDFVVRRNGIQELRQQMPGFQSSAQGQIDANREYIDEEMLFLSPEYIHLQLEKKKVNSAFNQLTFLEKE